MGPRIFFQQDGVYYNPSTKEPVDLSTVGKPQSPAPAATSLVCTFCGVQRATPELFREHLLAVHPQQVPDLVSGHARASQPPPVEPEPVKPVGKSKGKGK